MVSGTRVFYSGSSGSCMLGGGPPWIRPAPARLTDARSDWDLGTLEARSTPWAPYCVYQTVPDRCLRCVRAHCPAGGPLPSGSVVMRRGFLVHNSIWMGGAFT